MYKIQFSNIKGVFGSPTTLSRPTGKKVLWRVSDETQEERECHLLHKAVMREASQSTTMRIVFDAVKKANQGGPYLNDCLETGPPL